MSQGEEEEVKWNAELEVALFHSMHGHKPVGLNKHFNMVCIQHKLQQSVGMFLSTKQIRDHLKTLYDLDSLDDCEKFPFPNDERDFSLPEHLLPDRTQLINEGDMENVRKHTLHQSSSPSPASSPLNRPVPKRKRN